VRWLLILIISISAFACQAQSLTKVFELGKEQMELGQYEYAVQSLERVLYFAPANAPILTETYSRLAQCYRIKHNFSAAAQYYEFAFRVAENENNKNQLLINKAECLVLSGRYFEAKRDLFFFDEQKLTKSQQIAVNRLLGFSELGLDKLESAREYFNKTYAIKGVSVPDSISKLWNNLNKNWKAKARWAKISSVIIPGSGLIAIGEVKSGLNSFVLIAGIYSVGLLIARDFTLLDTFLTIAPWAQRYLKGGLVNIDVSIARKRQTIKNKIMQAWVAV